KSRNGRCRSRPPEWSSTDRGLFKLKRATDLVRKLQRADRDRRAGRQLFVALEAPIGERLAYCFLDLALGADTQSLEKLAQACVEGLFVHGLLQRVRAPKVRTAHIVQDATP